MIITKKSIRTLRPYIPFIQHGTKLAVGVKDLDRFKNTLVSVGFSDDLQTGDSVLPSGSFGTKSAFNAEGKYIKHKDQPMETAYRTTEWRWIEWHGRYERVEKSRLIDVPYKRYPRTFVIPPAIEIIVSEISDGNQILTSPIYEYTLETEEQIIHAVNLFLEIFGECQFFTERLDEIKSPVRRLNWRILPTGRRPWPQLKKELTTIIKGAPIGKQPVIEHRLKNLNQYKPDFTAVGVAGFHGYIVFGFEGNDLYVFESLYYGNATYFFDNQWEELSKLTKAEIINEDLQKDRLIHREGWDSKLRTILKSFGISQTTNGN